METITEARVKRHYTKYKKEFGLDEQEREQKYGELALNITKRKYRQTAGVKNLMKRLTLYIEDGVITVDLIESFVSQLKSKLS